MKSIRSVTESACKWDIASPDDYARFLDQNRKLGAEISAPRKVRSYDRYLDTEDRYFHSARASCRLCSVDGRWELTFKSSRKAENDIFSRMEETFELPDCESESEAIEYCQRSILAPILNDRRVIPLFALSRRRESRELVYPGGIRARSWFDEVEMHHLSRTVPVRELELQLLFGEERAFRDLVAQLTHLASIEPLHPFGFERAVETFGIAAAAYDEPRYRFDRETSVGKAAREIIRRDLQMIRDSEPAVRVGVYHDAIHDMRVACRRVRTALRAFKAMLPDDSRAVSREVAWLGRELGRGRDLEVQNVVLKNAAWLLSPDDRVNLQGYWEYLAQRFEDERRAIMQTLNSSRYAQLLQAIDNTVCSTARQNSPGGHAGQAGARMIGQTIRGIFAKYPRRNIQQKITDGSLHKLRIEMKRIRYLCEFFVQVSSPGMSGFIRKTKALQRILGDHQDFVTGNEMVKADSRNTDDPGCRRSLVKLAAILEEGKETQQAAFREVWGRF